MTSGAIEKASKFLELTTNPKLGFQFEISRNSDMSNSVPHPEIESFSTSFLFDIIQDIPGIPKDTLKILDDIIDIIPLDDVNAYIEKRLPHHSPYACNTGLEPSNVDTTSVRLWAKLKAGVLEIGDSDDRMRAQLLAKKLSLNYYLDRETICKYYLANVDEPDGDSVKGIDIAVMANVMRILYILEIDDEAKKTEDYVLQWFKKGLKKRKSYYTSLDWPIYLYSNCLTLSQRVSKRFGNIIAQRLWERIRSTESPLDLSLRILTAFNLGIIKGEEDKEQMKSQDKNFIEAVLMEVNKLKGLQNLDGSWPSESVLVNNLGLHLGSSFYTTCFALKALHVTKHL